MSVRQQCTYLPSLNHSGPTIKQFPFVYRSTYLDFFAQALRS